MAAGYRVRIDPWAADYDGAAGVLEAEAPDAVVDAAVEGIPWQAVRPVAGDRPHLAFVDGVRRIDCRAVIEQGQRHHFALFGSFAVGATLANDHARVVAERVARVLACGGGFRPEPVTLRLGGTDWPYRPETVADDTPEGPLRGLQNAMRRAEAELAPDLLAQADAVFVDGPLSPLGPDGAMVGYVKRLLRSYLPALEAGLLPRLQVGERTPLFLVQGAPLDRYSWYQRIGSGRSIDTALAGVVRCEVAAALGLERARQLADLAAAQLPRFASDPIRDPRAPQNLHPIGALETWLRHRLGDALLLRRALEVHLLAETAS